MKPYWFIEDPVDTEHKYYILMAKLKKIKESFGKKGFEKNFRDLLIIHKDLKSFETNLDLSQRSVINMTESEKNNFCNILNKNLDKIEEISEIVADSINTITKFINENPELEKEYNSIVSVESYCSNYSLWDQGFLVIRKEKESHMRIFSWFFSMISIEKKDSVALLMTELLNPQCETTTDVKKIKTFLKNNIKDYLENSDCILIADLENRIDMESGTEIGKEKSIEIILRNFRKT
jgi:hypothetical protein